MMMDGLVGAWDVSLQNTSMRGGRLTNRSSRDSLESFMSSHRNAELILTTAVGLINTIVVYERGHFKALKLIVHAVSIMKTNGGQTYANRNIFLNMHRHVVLICIVPYAAEKSMCYFCPLIY